MASLSVSPTDVAVEFDPASDGHSLLLETPRERMSAVLETLPRLGPLADLTVQDAAVEEIIRRVFERSALSTLVEQEA